MIYDFWYFLVPLLSFAYLQKYYRHLIIVSVIIILLYMYSYFY
jgi:hypothetical protein